MHVNPPMHPESITLVDMFQIPTPCSIVPLVTSHSIAVHHHFNSLKALPSVGIEPTPTSDTSARKQTPSCGGTRHRARRYRRYRSNSEQLHNTRCLRRCPVDVASAVQCKTSWRNRSRLELRSPRRNLCRGCSLMSRCI